MQIISATDLARNTREILDSVANRRETIAVERNHALIAKIIPAEPTMTAAQTLAGLPPPMLTAAQAAGWLKDSRAGFDETIPLPVERAMTPLGRNISLARRRRNMTQQMLAERIGASVNTVRRMEDGFAGTALQHVFRALQVFGELGQLEALLDTPQDSVGLALMDEKLPLRVRTRRRAPDSGAF